MAPKRISICMNALLLPPNLGGIGNVAFHLLTHLRKARPDWELTLLVNPAAAPEFKSIPGLILRAPSIRSRWGRLLYLHLAFPWDARRYDLVHSIGNMGLVFCPVPQVITIHDAYERVSPERFGAAKRMLMSLLVSASGRRARRILAVSRHTAADVARFYPHLAGKIDVVYSGNKFPLAAGASADGRDGFLFVGTLEPGKNLSLALRAFAAFRSAHAGKFRIVGAKGWSQSGLPALIDSLGIREEVEFLGYLPDAELRAWYGRSLALIQPSNYEGFGLPVIEAMACGCPVIAARNSGLIEAGGSAALFFETGDEKGLAMRMAEVAGDREARQACIEKGLEHAAGFTWEKTAAAVAGAYETILERKPG
jgi:glycosyltransferase involved in cell wall biosynthesis